MVDAVTDHGSAPSATLTAPEADGQPEELIAYLESDQLVQERSHPVPRAKLSPRRRRMLWSLRVIGLALSAMVVYTFVSQLTA